MECTFFSKMITVYVPSKIMLNLLLHKRSLFFKVI